MTIDADGEAIRILVERATLAERERDAARAEVDRLRKIFDDAGQGEHNVLALVEHYQEMAAEADDRAFLAYPRALQAAADVVLNADLSLFDDEASGLGWLDDVANCICDLTEEQIEAFDAKATPAMVEAADAFAAAIEREYVSWACEVVEKRVVNVREWCAVHRPDWLAQLPAVEPEEGGDHG